ncbi:hypothetical protein ACFS5N_14345 [Mucilaginibacter ximonensis]|uniref:Uncharacterized protein n=1 Tax=Mucilaginibacter ximonensis TaxID=538021 RepID=A0ABW5YFQ3_9SPHI
MSYSVRLLLLAILFYTAKGLFAQEIVNKGDIAIHIVDADAWGMHKFFIDIYKHRNQVKIVYAHRDSIKHAEIRRDPAYKPISHAAFRYPSSDPRGQSALDSLTKYFDLHSVYTRDSVTIDIKHDTAYGNLLSRIAKTSEAELKRKHDDVHVLDGDFPSFIVITNRENKKAEAQSPTMQSHPLLFTLLHHTMEEGKSLKAADKIRKYYGY